MQMLLLIFIIIFVSVEIVLYSLFCLINNDAAKVNLYFSTGLLSHITYVCSLLKRCKQSIFVISVWVVIYFIKLNFQNIYDDNKHA